MVEELKQDSHRADPESKPSLKKRKAGKRGRRARKEWKPLDLVDTADIPAVVDRKPSATSSLGLNQASGGACNQSSTMQGGARLQLCPLGGIARKPTHLSPVTSREVTWEKLTLTVDSGASDTVIPPSCMEWSFLFHTPKVGSEYEVANGAVVHNLGERRFIMRLSDKGDELELACQVVEDVHKPLLAVSSITAQGHQVVFGKEESYILLSSGEKLAMRNENGVYGLDIWVKSLGFTRPSSQ